MKVLQIVRPGEIELIDLPVPEPGPGQVLVKIEAITTCPHWDMHILGGQQMLPGLALNYPYTPGQPGHEACGEIAAVGSGVYDLQVGQRVCVWRDPGHHLPGCYAEYVVKDTHDVLPIPATGKAEHWAPLELAMCVSAHIMLAGKLDLLAQKRVAVFGLGPAGLLFTQFAAAAGATEVIGIDPLAERRALALQLGASHAYAPDSDEALALPPRNQPDSIDTAFDCVGHPAPVQRAMDLASKLVVLFAVQRQPYTFQPHHWGRLILAGAQPHTREAAIYARDRIAAGKVTMAPLVTTTLPLSEYLHGVELLRSQQALKVAFLPGAD
jgi:threonine dehydrogenase-like Zn-dependent dehydrogenase